MSIFNWFSNPPQTKTAPEETHRPAGSRRKSAAAPSQEPEADTRSDSAKLRHLRRDQVFVAIREAMTKTGVLSTHYKFKVLSEDTQGNEFVVMTSLVTEAGEPAPLLGEIEAAIIEHAKARFGIVVSAVYWRLTEVAASGKFVPPVRAAAVAAAAAAAAEQPAKAEKPVKPAKSVSPHETIDADEVVAFQQALLAASKQGPSVPPVKGSKPARGPRNAGKLKDFQDTEMSESISPPTLSKTQYGDLR